MAEASLPHRKQGKRTNFRWSLLTGLALGIASAVCLYFVLENAALGSFVNQWGTIMLLAYELPIALFFFAIGFLRGRATGKLLDGVQVIVGVSLIQALTALVLFGVFSQVFHFWYADHHSVLYALFAFDIENGYVGAALFLAEPFFAQIFWGPFIALIGGAIGNHFFYQQPKPGETTLP